MKNTAIYCRVSTDNQEAEGTSLQTQLEACRNYCQGKGYDVAYRFSPENGAAPSPGRNVPTPSELNEHWV